MERFSLSFTPGRRGKVLGQERESRAGEASTGDLEIDEVENINEYELNQKRESIVI